MLGSFGQLVVSVLCLCVLYKGHKVSMSSLCSLQDDKGPSEEERRRMSLEEVSEGRGHVSLSKVLGTVQQWNGGVYKVNIPPSSPRHARVSPSTRTETPFWRPSKSTRYLAPFD